jgi:hypothetical protein
MKLPIWAWILLAIALFGFWQHRWTPRALNVPEGVIVAPKPPLQTELGSDKASWSWQGYTLKPLANFSADARLLSVAWYRHGRESELSPVDLGLAGAI